MPENNYLIIPIEILCRELDSRLLLALECLKRRYNVILGEQEAVKENICNFSKGIYFDKSLAKNKLPFFKRLKVLGHKLVSNDEEGLMAINNTYSYLNNRHCDENFMNCELFFCWGEDERRLLNNYYPKYKNKIKNSGNIRVDLWEIDLTKKLYEYEINEIKNKYNKYILMATNFAYPHSRGDESFLFKQAVHFGVINNPGEYYLWQNKREYKIKCYKAFKSLVINLSKSIDSNIILRPHPAENVDHWKQITKDLNVHVESDYSISPWISEAECVIHNSCTSGLESYYQGTRTISYLPYTENEDVRHPSNTVSRIAENESQIIQFLNNGSTVQNNRSKINLNITKSGHNHISIVNYLDTIKFKSEKTDTKSFIECERNKPDLQKFPNVSLDYLKEKISRLAQIYRYNLKLDVKQMTTNLWSLEPR
jgi:surface carbohydrate biosynthesis protein